ncbi:DUF6468 domain-containing protein [Muricoccus radiodurans]|uniref:DUF6468 domain-containing protein n=1 Tax=Muricoccus radiodurans TaxID=2231721 RepID=UPI003CEF7EBA
MSGIEWAVQGVLLLMLGVALPFMVRLQRQIAALRRDPQLIAEGAEGFTQAAREAQASLDRMRGMVEAGGRHLEERVETAGALRDDLRFLIERGTALADRMEALVTQARPLAADPSRAAAQPAGGAATGSRGVHPSGGNPQPAGSVGAAPGSTPGGAYPAPRSTAERDLLQALARAK